MFTVRTLLTGITTVFKDVNGGDSLARGWGESIKWFGLDDGERHAVSTRWGESIKWFGLDDGERHAVSNRKPVMIIIHKPTCPVCIRLKSRFSVSSGIRELSENFVMINLLPNEASRSGLFEPDGKYVPRILFLSPDFVLLTDVKGNAALYKYFYDDVSLIESKMRIVLNRSF